MRQQATGFFEFDDLDLLAADGWRLRAGFEGLAFVDGDGQIISIAVRAYKAGKQQNITIHREDGQIHDDLIAALHAQYAASIEDAAESARAQEAQRPAYSYAG